MAKGFAAGLIQGTVVCGAALVALSLALPQPPRPEQVAALPESAPESTSVTSSTASSVTSSTASSGTTLAGPAAESLQVPAGSEFNRSTDMQPQAPAPLSEAPRVAAAPAVAKPADEPAPATAEPERLRPEARGDAPAAPALAEPENDPIDLPELAGEAPIPVPPPGKVVVPGLDRAPGGLVMQPDSAPVAPAAATPEAAPEPVTAQVPQTQPAPPAEASGEAMTEAAAEIVPELTVVPEPTPDTVPETEPTPAAAQSAAAEPATPEPVAEPVAKPAAPQPGAVRAAPDLSLPPDFGALHLTE